MNCFFIIAAIEVLQIVDKSRPREDPVSAAGVFPVRELVAGALWPPSSFGNAVHIADVILSGQSYRESFLFF
jgi:hypothetical protein